MADERKLGRDGAVTINDIARLAGVSKKTVSRVINKSPLVRDETRARVEAVIREQGYTPDPQARALAFGRSFLVGLIYDNPSPQYVVNMQRGILDALGDSGFQLVLRPCDRDEPDLLERLRAFVQQQKPAGVILTPSISEDEDVADMLRAVGCPYVRIASVPLDQPARMVRTQDARGAAQAARHLAGLGHKRIAYVHGPNRFRSTHQRLAGFEVGLEEHGLSLADSLVVEGAYTFDSGVAAGATLFGRADPPTAVFAGNDEMATGLYHAAREAGLSIPEDVSIVGYDDTPIAARMWPPLTSVRTAIRRMGQAATQLLLDLPGSEEQPATLLDPELIVRGSTAPPRA